jgi:hypothetical protein
MTRRTAPRTRISVRSVRLVPGARFAPVHTFRCHLDNDRMELAGLEPATSWVRSKLARAILRSEGVDLQRLLCRFETALRGR